MNRSALNLRSLAPLIVLMIIMTGCGGAPEDGYTGARGQVSGKITLGGEPIPSGSTVTFEGTKGKNSYNATGVVADGGRYTLKYRVAAGLPAVDYLVQLAPPIGPVSTAAVDPAKMGAIPDPKALTKDGNPFPLMYLSTATSKLKHTVKAGANTADFDLIAEKK